LFNNGIYWLGLDGNTPINIRYPYLYIDNHIFFGEDCELYENDDMEEVQADFFIKTNGTLEVLDVILEGTIVKTKRNDGYETQSVYYAKCGDKHAVDFNGTSAMIVDEVEVIQNITKKEAKQKVSELFANSCKKITSQQIRNIINLIK